MEKIVVANLKMNLSMREIIDYINGLENTIDTKKVIICPTSIYLPYFLKKKYDVGIQNIAGVPNGAYTGEISASQVASLGIKYAIVGHSERRKYYNENDVIINNKIKEGLKNKLKIFLCIGESFSDKESNKTEEVLKKQIINALNDININDIKSIIIAYEPIWSIGTGNIPSNDNIESVCKYIKEIVNDIYDDEINIPVIYGGSINEENIVEINNVKNISGVLVGGASLNPDKLNKIKEVVIG